MLMRLKSGGVYVSKRLPLEADNIGLLTAMTNTRQMAKVHRRERLAEPILLNEELCWRNCPKMHNGIERVRECVQERSGQDGRQHGEQLNNAVSALCKPNSTEAMDEHAILKDVKRVRVKGT
jgi:hypothetical protein